MDPKTATKYIDHPELPRPPKPRGYRTRKDPLAEFWNEIVQLVSANPKLKPYAIHEHLLERYPERYLPTYRRTLERRVARLHDEQGAEKDVKFTQVHKPADVLAFDFTDMSSLSVTIAGESFPHLLFHSVLTYSNWEYVELCFSESFEAAASGLTGSFLALGGVTQRVRNDSLTAAVNNLSHDREFQSHYRALLTHYGVSGHRINVRSPHENGDCESLHGKFKDLNH